MTALLVITITLLVAGAAKAHRAALHPAGSLAAPWLHQGKHFRANTQALRVGKCLGRFNVRWVPYSDMPVGLRRWAAGLWLERYRKARNLSSSCLPWYVTKQINVGWKLAVESAADPWPNCPDPGPIDNQGPGHSWTDTVNCENGGQWTDSPGFYRCGLQFHPNWELVYGRLCP